MRLFIAINFKESSKDTIQRIIREIKGSSVQGKFVQNEHLHLTLEFLGEIQPSRMGIIMDVMEQVVVHPFTIQLSGIGFFRRREGDICWLGIGENKSLYELQSQLHERLVENGFKLEDRAYKPHITIGRKVKMDNSFIPETLDTCIKGISMDIDKIDLMKSEHINGRLVYSTVYTRDLR